MKTKLKQPNRWQRWGIYFGVVMTFLMVDAALDGRLNVQNTPLIILSAGLLMLGVFMAVLVHELGHYLAGRLGNLWFLALTVGPFTLFRDRDTGDRLRSSLASGTTGALGYCLFRFPDAPSITLRRRVIAFSAGGPIASVVLAVGAPMISNTLMVTAPTTVSIAWLLAYSIGAAGGISAVFALSNLFPSRWFSTDGRKLLELLASPARAERLITQMQIGQGAFQGMLPRDWNAQQVQQLLLPADQSVMHLSAHTYAYRWALDRRDLATAERHLVYAIKHRKKLSPADRANLIVEAAFFECRFRANKDDAERWLKKLGKDVRLASSYARMRLACAAHFALGQHTEAQKIANDLLSYLEPMKDGFSSAERDLIQEMIAIGKAQGQASA